MGANGRLRKTCSLLGGGLEALRTLQDPKHPRLSNETWPVGRFWGGCMAVTTSHWSHPSPCHPVSMGGHVGRGEASVSHRKATRPFISAKRLCSRGSLGGGAETAASSSSRIRGIPRSTISEMCAARATFAVLDTAGRLHQGCGNRTLTSVLHLQTT